MDQVIAKPDISRMDLQTIVSCVGINHRDYKHMKGEFLMEHNLKNRNEVVFPLLFPFGYYLDSLVTLELTCTVRSHKHSEDLPLLDYNFPALQKLTIRCCCDAKNHRALLNFMNLSDFPVLTHLKMTDGIKVLDAKKRSILQFPRTLKVLSVDKSDHVNYTKHWEMSCVNSKDNPMIEKLAIPAFDLNILIEFSHSLTHLQIDNSISPVDAVMIFRCLKLLQYLHFESLNRTRFMDLVPFPLNKSIETLSIGTTNTFYGQMMRSLPNLKMLITSQTVGFQIVDYLGKIISNFID
jgi:hypothetical protein